MCEECSDHRVGPLLTALREALKGLDAENEHAAAALVDEAIRIVERNVMSK